MYELTVFISFTKFIFGAIVVGSASRDTLFNLGVCFWTNISEILQYQILVNIIDQSLQWLITLQISNLGLHTLPLTPIHSYLWLHIWPKRNVFIFLIIMKVKMVFKFTVSCDKLITSFAYSSLIYKIPFKNLQLK